MLLSLLAVVLASPPSGPVLWRFTGDNGEMVREAVLAVRGDHLPHHLIDEAALEAHLATLTLTADLGCLEDRGVCPDSSRAVLGALGFAGRVDATSEGVPGGYVVTLRLTPTDGGDPRDFEGRGVELDLAAQQAFAAIRGHGTLRIEVEPGAVLFIDEEPFGEGPGDYPVAPGTHAVRAEAKGRRGQEQSVTVAAGETRSLKFDLVDAYGRLALTFAPEGASVSLDGEPWADPSEERELPPGPHKIRLEAEGHEPHEHEFEIRSGKRLALTVALQEAEPEWKKMLRDGHPDNDAHPYYARVGVRLGTVNEGDVDAATGSGNHRVGVARQQDSTGSFGADVAIGWRHGLLTLEVAGLGVQGGGEATSAELDDGTGRMTDLTRVTLRITSVGVRYPAWRLEPYAAAGPVLGWEFFTVETDDGEKHDVTNRLFLIGVDLGVRYHLTPEWFGAVGATIDFWPGDRTVASALLSVGYALELPKWL